MSATLSLTRLARHHPGEQHPALAGIDLEVPAGACTAILGPSGSGKSTALRLIAGLDAPTGGSVALDGVDVTALPPERRGVGMVFQRPLLFPHLSVIDNVGFAARASGQSRSASRSSARRYLELVHLEDLADRPVGAISGGQAQRVALARSLANAPRVLLLDEPFSALDSVLREDMYELVREIRKELSPTIVLVTHDRHEAAVLADSVAVLIDGVLEHHSEVSSAYTQPSTRAVNRLMGGINEIHGHLERGVHHSDLGALHLPPDGPVPDDGPAVLLIRHEMIRIVDGSPDLPRGVICGARPAGLRSIADVRIGSVMVHVELPTGTTAPVGTEVGLEIPAAACTAVTR
ncbi:ABC transporter ATP-binding protein [Rhodococcus xishaensis]|uniref:ABC transporter ATP-binding protein n=1 Tax=Rhodococcus xishaensis TaxID=2487364 RepID=A0A3S3ZJ69_9NOCA|nr:ABC transporter ATP-binding protein [Rhodococcus xishaensis]RVW01940.1 ABC transporter ATP-binding protein [Rhodococcus xishaensis]